MSKQQPYYNIKYEIFTAKKIKMR